MTDTISSDSVAQDQIQSFFDRWHRLESEKQAISDDLKEMFAEMKGNGFDTKVARKLFRDMTTDQTVKSEFDALYDLYHAALTAPRAGRAREEAKVTTSNTSISEGFDPETGEEITTPSGNPAGATTGPISPSETTVVASHSSNMHEMQIASDVPAAPEPPSPAAAAQAVPSAAQAGEVSSKASPAPIQPETADEIESGERAVTGIGPESTAKSRRTLRTPLSPPSLPSGVRRASRARALSLRPHRASPTILKPTSSTPRALCASMAAVIRRCAAAASPG